MFSTVRQTIKYKMLSISFYYIVYVLFFAVIRLSLSFARQTIVFFFCISLCVIAVCSFDQKVVIQDAQLSQRDRAAGCVIVFGQKWKTGTGRQYLTDIIGLSSTTVT